MDENLVGYLLKALDPDEQRQVQDYLREHPEAHKRLEQLRRQFDLLAADAVEEEPPPQLWVGALARIAEYQCRNLPQAPRAGTQSVGGRGRWRRVDVLVAAALLLVVGGFAVTLVHKLRDMDRVTACQENLRRFHHALFAYSRLTEDGHFPRIESQPPKHLAGSFIPILHDAGLLPTDVSVACPANGHRPPPPRSVSDLQEAWERSPDEGRALARSLAGCYAYSLGYRNGPNSHLGLTNRMEDDIPIMADRPPPVGAADFTVGNSPNHGGKGQNVLYIGGHVRFCTNRAAGWNGDDIYVNAAGLVGAGRDRHDSVLGAGDASPYPTGE